MLAFATEIASHPSSPTLAVLSLWLGKSAPSRDCVPLPPSVFHPLISIRDLKRIGLRGECFIGVEDATLSTMAKAWPKMERLSLLPEPRRGTNPLVIRASLWTCGVFAENCPNIVELSIPLEDSTPGAITHSLETCTKRTNARKMELLGVGPSCISIRHTASMSALMSLWFPSLRCIQFDEPSEEGTTTIVHHGESHTMQEFWDMVTLDIWTKFQRIREQECRWRRGFIRTTNRRNHSR